MKKFIIYRMLTVLVLGFMVNHAAAQTAQWKTDSLNNIIEGKVIDSATGKPVPFDIIRIKGTRINMAADGYGEFEYKVPPRILKRHHILQIISCGYDTLESSFYQKMYILKFVKPCPVVVTNLQCLQRQTRKQRKNKN